jgi:chromosomal replication initiation ATPase DnaA
LARIRAEAIAPLLDRSVAAVRMRRHKLNLAPPDGRVRHASSAPSAISVAAIKNIVADHFNTPVEWMNAASRKREATHPRQVAMFFAREVAHKSFPKIGLLFGNRDHTTVLHAVRKVERLIEESQDFKNDVNAIFAELTPCGVHTVVDKTHILAFVENQLAA